MRLLFVTQWYPPEPYEIVRELAQELATQGHEVQVLTGFPNYPHGKLYPGYRMRPAAVERDGAVRVIRAMLYPEHSRSALRRVMNYLSFSAGALLAGLMRAEPYDVVIVHASPYTAALPALLLGLRRRVPVVLSVADLWPDSLSATGMMTWQPALTLAGWFCKRVYRLVDRIHVVTPGYARTLEARGVPPAKITYAPNWVDVDAVRPLPRDDDYARSLGIADGQCVVVYSGNIGLAQDLMTVVLAAERLAALRPDVVVVIAGDGVSFAEVRTAAEERSLANIRFTGALPKSEMPRLYSIADALLVHLRDQPLFRVTIPHKVPGYLAAGKPVIAALAGDGAEVVTAAGAGIACRPGDPEALAATIATFAALPRSERESMSAAARETAVRDYSQKNAVGRIAELMEEAIRSRSRRP